MLQFLKRLSRSSKPRNDAVEAPVDPKAYRVFTSEFDVVTHAGELSSVIGPMSGEEKADLRQAFDTFKDALLGWKTKARIASLEASNELRNVKTTEDLENTVVTILVDHSRSMAGRNMLLAAAACQIAMEFLGAMNVKLEVLGFTTVGWRGGKCRRLWEQQGKRAAPGRLAETLHIIYKSSELAYREGRAYLLEPMLRLGLLKENIDGEAIEWAISRQMDIQAERRIVVVLSDGVPCDDATLSANDTNYLSRHLKQVIAQTEMQGAVELVGVGVGYDASQYYRTSARIDEIDDLGTTLIDVLRDALKKDFA